jgi:hypothetical protein
VADALRRGDPAAVDSAMTEDERQRVRSRLASAPSAAAPPRAYGWSTAVVAVAAGLLVLAVVWNRPTGGELSAPAESAAAPVPAKVESPAGRERTQQIRIITKNGTQIIWILNPDLEL